MVSTLFITLPVDSTLRSRRFFESLGFRPDEVFCDAGTLCLPISDGTVLVLLATQRFAGYSAGEAAVDPRRGDAAVREVVIAFSAVSRHEVDEIADAALANGGSTLRAPTDEGFTYSRTFCDPDGHAWEIVWMDPGAIPQTSK